MKWILVCCLWFVGVGQAAPLVVSQPKLVATDPDGPCVLTWSPDSHSVSLDPFDKRQNLQWGEVWLDAKKPFDGEFLAKTPVADSPAFQLQSGEDKRTAIVLTSPLKKRNIPLENTPWEYFGYELLDGGQVRWRFQASRFSRDQKEISIIAGGAISTWSTTTGKLLRKVRLTAPQSVDEGYPFASFSSDESLVVSSLADETASAAVFEARTGKRIFTFASSESFYFWAGFFLDARFVVSRKLSPNGTAWTLWDVQKKRKTWSATSDLQSGFQLLRSNVVMVSAADGIELREVISGQTQKILAHPAQSVNSVAASPDGSQIWASYANGEIWSWQVR